ncbi:MAG: hypothetical protein R3D89_13770 [Sphingomonadaceae bacterium]
MKIKLLIAAAVVATSAPALADDVVEVQKATAATQEAAAAPLKLRAGQMVYSADGSRIGRIYAVVGEKDAPEAIRIIVDSQMVVIPADTLSPGEKSSRTVTSLDKNELK